MDRLNSEGIPRKDLLWALRQGKIVATARRMDSCLLCRRRGVDESGLCNVCVSALTDEEQVLVESWRRGTGP